jgi:hypothetical protein
MTCSQQYHHLRCDFANASASSTFDSDPSASSLPLRLCSRTRPQLAHIVERQFVCQCAVAAACHARPASAQPARTSGAVFGWKQQHVAFSAPASSVSPQPLPSPLPLLGATSSSSTTLLNASFSAEEVPVGAAILPLLQRSKLQRRYKALLQQHKSVATIAAPAARCVWQNTFHLSHRMWNEIHQWKEAKLGAAAGIISQRIRARLSRSSFSNQRDADAAAAVSVQARIRCALGRQAWSQRVRGMQALACAVSTKLSRRRAIAAAAGAVAGCTGRMQGEAAVDWITM